MSALDDALDDLRHAVHKCECAYTPIEKGYWADQVNQCAYRVNVEIHNEFPDHHKHPGDYRPLQHGSAS